jgi:dTDP-4-amino-4,6-dideoxygalactose transaminase
MSIFSFHPVKSITTGEGGAVVTNNASFARNIRLFRTHGVTTDKRGFIRPSDGLWYQEQQELGFNYRLTDMQAALGTSQLSRLEKYIERRRALAKRYQKLLQHVRGIMLPPADTPESASAWHLYVVQVDQKRRRKIFEMMRQSGIGVQVHHVPVYRHPYYEKLGYIKGLCPKTELFYSRAISLPIFPALSAREQDTIVSTLKQLV